MERILKRRVHHGSQETTRHLQLQEGIRAKTKSPGVTGGESLAVITVVTGTHGLLTGRRDTTGKVPIRWSSAIISWVPEVVGGPPRRTVTTVQGYTNGSWMINETDGPWPSPSLSLFDTPTTLSSTKTIDRTDPNHPISLHKLHKQDFTKLVVLIIPSLKATKNSRHHE